jgi:hypothetical protein
MDTVLDVSLRSYQLSAKLSKKLLISQLLLLVFNITILFFDYYLFMTTPSKLTSVSFGAMLVTCLWTIVWSLQTWSEWRGDLSNIEFIIQLKEQTLASQEMESFLQAKNEYERLIKTLKEKQTHEQRI